MPKHGFGVSHDSRRRENPFVVRVRQLDGKFKVIGYYSTVDEAKVSADRALIKRFLMHGNRVTNLNHEHMRQTYVREIKRELMVRFNSDPRSKRVYWFLFNDETDEEPEDPPQQQQQQPQIEEEDEDAIMLTAEDLKEFLDVDV